MKKTPAEGGGFLHFFQKFLLYGGGLVKMSIGNDFGLCITILQDPPQMTNTPAMWGCCKKDIDIQI